MSDGPVAIVAGTGSLPELLAGSITRSGREVFLVLMGGIYPDWAAGYTSFEAAFEKPGRVFEALSKAGCKELIFAGSMVRPRLNPLKFDAKMVSIAFKVLPALKGGDNGALKVISEVFEAEGLTIVGAHEYLEELLSPAGTLTKSTPTQNDFADIERAKSIVKHLGHADTGQGAVVAQGLCLGLETVQGTDVMLDFVANTASNYRPDAKGGQGILLKAPKPGQDWRIDLPAIGPETVENASKAGLSGIAVQSKSVLILGIEKTVERANKLGLFIHAFEVEDVADTQALQ